MSKDWKGNDKSVWKILGASSHTEEEREINDYYATEPLAMELLLKEEEFDNNIWECAVGGGHLAEVLKNTGHNVRCSDIIDRGYPQTEIIDFLKVVPDSQNLWNGDIITNPPYSFAQAFVEKAMDLIQDGHKVAMFLKLTFLEGKSRKGMFKKYPPKIIYVSSSRLKCCKNGDFENNFSSAVAYGWFVWEKGFQGDPIIKWIN